MNETPIAEMLRIYRATRQIGVRELGKMIGISHGTVSRIERGFGCDLDTFLKVVNWLFNKQ